jgi:hypothetical protein
MSVDVEEVVAETVRDIDGWLAPHTTETTDRFVEAAQYPQANALVPAIGQPRWFGSAACPFGWAPDNSRSICGTPVCLAA